ncbi:hypothetical protein, partial [Frankia sp. CiP1_Cm_nod2]|uniref:hypothetical protein n=1 Tax=Frankia sp. CiP1_Cm_nod2 TaxID=2897161 RepID=UPI002024AAF7
MGPPAILWNVDGTPLSPAGHVARDVLDPAGHIARNILDAVELDERTGPEIACPLVGSASGKPARGGDPAETVAVSVGRVRRMPPTELPRHV